MVNSVKTTVNSETGSGSLSIALLDPLNTGNGVNEVPAGLLNPIGVWGFSQTGVTINSADLTFRYDDGLAVTDSIPESSLGLFHYDGFNWDPVSATLNTSNHTLFAPGVTSFSDYAVAEVPEPGTLIMLGGLGLSLSIVWRRRKRADA